MSNIENEFTINGTSYRVNMPSHRENKIAQMEYNKAYGEAIKSGAVLRIKLHEYMAEQKLWTEEKTEELKRLADAIADAELKLQSGGIKLNEAIELAKQTRVNRDLVQNLISSRSAADSNTAEGQAENIRFQRLLTVCLVYKDSGSPVFSNVEDLLDTTQNDKDKSEAAAKAFDILSKFVYKLDDQFEAKLPENKFLKEWKLVDDKLRYINAKGQLVNSQGKLVNEDGRFIDEEGHFVDLDGQIITEEGERVINEIKPFLDENGNPLTPP